MRGKSWDPHKSDHLKKTRGFSFEEVLQFELITVVDHPSKSHQGLMLFLREGYVWVIPFVESSECVFLKTLFASRKYTKLFYGGKL